jgi:hypothetical protein
MPDTALFKNRLFYPVLQVMGKQAASVAEEY